MSDDAAPATPSPPAPPPAAAPSPPPAPPPAAPAGDGRWARRGTVLAVVAGAVVVAGLLFGGGFATGRLTAPAGRDAPAPVRWEIELPGLGLPDGADAPDRSPDRWHLRGGPCERGSVG